MAQATQQIYTDNPGSIPATFALPAGLDLVIQSIVARWNGAAAAGSFKPCLSVYSQDDRLVGRFFPDTDLDTGDTAVVTYAPFLRGAAAAEAGGLSVAKVSSTGIGTLTTTTLLDWSSGTFSTNDAGTFALAADSKSITIKRDGYYVAVASIWRQSGGNNGADRYLTAWQGAFPGFGNGWSEFTGMGASLALRLQSAAADPMNDFGGDNISANTQMGLVVQHTVTDVDLVNLPTGMHIWRLGEQLT